MEKIRRTLGKTLASYLGDGDFSAHGYTICILITNQRFLEAAEIMQEFSMAYFLYFP